MSTNKSTVLHVAVIEKRTELLPLLVEAGTNVNAANDASETCLMFAAHHVRGLVLLLRVAADWWRRRIAGWPIFWRVCVGDLEGVLLSVLFFFWGGGVISLSLS